MQVAFMSWKARAKSQTETWMGDMEGLRYKGARRAR